MVVVAEVMTVLATTTISSKRKCLKWDGDTQLATSELLMVVNMKSTVFWTAIPYSLAVSYKITWVKETTHERLQSRRRKEFRNITENLFLN
jgi:hypothetical protein